jgi:hypothetical protein
MLCNATTNQKRGGSSRLSFVTKMGFALAAMMGTLLFGNSASAQYSDYFRADDTRSNRAIGYDRDYNSNIYENRYGNPAEGLGSHWNDRPAYGDFQGDRYSPEPAYGSQSRDRLSRRDSLPRRDRLNGEFGSEELNQGGYRDHTTRRIPLPDWNDNQRELPSYGQPQSDIRYRDNYSPYESPLPRDYNSPRLPLPTDRLNLGDYRNNNDYRNEYPAPPRPAIRPTEELSEVEQIPILGTGKLDLKALKQLAETRIARKSNISRSA